MFDIVLRSVSVHKNDLGLNQSHKKQMDQEQVMYNATDVTLARLQLINIIIIQNM